MSKDLEYFKDFLENPALFKVREFYSMLREFVDYINAHKDDFNYHEDEEWREIRERVFVELEKKEKLKAEFVALDVKMELASEKGTDADKINVNKEWIEFMKRNKFQYDFTDEMIKESEKRLNVFINSIIDHEFKEKELKESEIKLQKALAKLDNSIFANYERTGKRPILTSLKSKKPIKGN